ncbi:S41 family peptidase [Aquimarina aggregata]|uniref:S41 family peptidase n=1 Tax=Aquimarina aggregata TaxID=1642818 RepID=UPI00248F7B83|nr:S41 family peptidase [Aquimarina aggregata]
MMIRKVLSCLSIVVLTSCSSVEKYNNQISKLHNPEEIREDIDFAYQKLKRLHPDLYWYISKDSLNQKISDLKKNIQEPISSLEFYKQFAPVIASIRQGHTSIYSPRKKQTKKEKKSKGKRSYPFKPLAFHRIGDDLFIKKNYDKDSVFVKGVQVLSVDNQEIKDVFSDFTNLYTGDGYNTTFVPRYVGNGFGPLYAGTHKQKDSVLMTLKSGDSIYSKFLYAKYSKPKKTTKNKLKKDKDSTIIRAKKQSKSDDKITRRKKKARRKLNNKYGFNTYKKEYNRNFKFIASDTALAIAYMKIRSFTRGNYKDFYKESFIKIDSAKSKHLIIDLRDNLGGRIAEIDELYSYLTDKEYVFIKESKMTKRTNFLYPAFHGKPWVKKVGATLVSPVLFGYQLFKVKKENGEPYFKLKFSRLQKPKVNAYTGKIYVLINGASFSASSILSTHLKATKRAVFVGEETGGAYNGTIAGLFALVELPNSKVKMRVGLMKINAPYTVDQDGFGIKPDIYVSETIGTDNPLDWVINNIKGSN